MISGHSRPLRAFAAGCGVLCLLGGSSQAATPGDGVAPTLLSVSAGPAYSTSRTLSTDHQLDCSATNPYWNNNACTVNIKVASTAGCLWESQSTDNGAPPERSACSVSITGPIRWRVAAQFCQLYGDPLSLEVTFTPGKQPGRSMAPIVFQATGTLVPTQFGADRLSTRVYHLTVSASAARANVNLLGAVATANIKEVFEVRFAVPVSDTCPNRDTNTLSIGNIRDIRSDATPQGAATAGFVNAFIAAAV